MELRKWRERFGSRRLPHPEDPGDEEVLAHIEEFGFYAQHVRPYNHPEHAEENARMGPHPIYDIGFSYTVGLPHTRDHPEVVIVTGMEMERAHDILWQVVRLVRDDGMRFLAGDESDRVLVAAPVRFVAVSDERRKELLTFSDWAARRKPFEALQALLPDADDRFPGGPGYAGESQPLLS